MTVHMQMTFKQRGELSFVFFDYTGCLKICRVANDGETNFERTFRVLSSIFANVFTEITLTLHRFYSSLESPQATSILSNSISHFDVANGHD